MLVNSRSERQLVRHKIIREYPSSWEQANISPPREVKPPLVPLFPDLPLSPALTLSSLILSYPLFLAVPFHPVDSFLRRTKARSNQTKTPRVKLGIYHSVLLVGGHTGEVMLHRVVSYKREKSKIEIKGKTRKDTLILQPLVI